jgi:Lrp/AsnC family leucine-responsive transcriptional regulator
LLGSITVDELDLRILAALEEDSSRPLRKLSEELGIPISTLHSRIKRLRAEGVIRGFRALVDPEKLGLSTLAFILISVSEGDQRAIARRIASFRGVQEVHIVTGEFDIIVKARARNIRELSELVLSRIRGVEGVAKTLTSVVFLPVKEDPRKAIHVIP